MRAFKILFLAAAWLGGALRAGAQAVSSESPGLSRDMLLGIYFYDQGDDAQALEKFGAILNGGNPAERPLARDYLNMITERMNPAAETPRPPPVYRGARTSIEALPSKPESSAESGGPAMIAVVRQASPPPPGTGIGAWPGPLSTQRPLVPVEDVAVRREVQAQLDDEVGKGLASWGAVKGSRIIMKQNYRERPLAIAIPATALFNKQTEMRRGADALLAALAQIVFGLGEAQVQILPEGTAFAKASVLDMRRTLAIASYLVDRGISGPRVHVNLLNTQVDIPEALGTYKGIIILFVYDQPLDLEGDSASAAPGTPPLSLGVTPAAFKAEGYQGTLIEFAVEKPPSGLVSWRLTLGLPPTEKGFRPAPIEEFVGVGPVYEQLFWSGRTHFWGPPLPSGRYLCRLQATDFKNKTLVAERWIDLKGAGAPAAAKSPAATPAQAAPAHKSSALRRAHRRKARKRVRLPIKIYRFHFDRRSFEWSSRLNAALQRVAMTLLAHPKEKARIVGYASSKEPHAEDLALKRGEMTAGLLINRYNADPFRVWVSTRVAGSLPPEAVLSFSKGGPS